MQTYGIYLWDIYIYRVITKIESTVDIYKILTKNSMSIKSNVDMEKEGGGMCWRFEG